MTDGVSTDDWHLLRRFTEHDSQEAFAVLTARYLNLVYSVFRRELDDAEAAEDVTQAVFLILARKAPTLRRSVVLSGWLFQTARFVARNARTQAQRRVAYEQKAAEAMQQQSETRGNAAWAEIEPLLNQSLAALRGGERDCVLLRFFQGLSFAEAGTALGLSEEAARKRVTRALEKMRRFLGKEGVIVPGVALATLLSAYAAKAAPAHVALVVAQMVPGLAVGPVSLIVKGTQQAMKIAKLKAVVGVAAIILLGGFAYTIAQGEAARAAQERRENVMLLNAPVPWPDAVLPPPAVKDADRDVVLAGSVHYEDGSPAGGVQVVAQIQNKAMMQQFDALRARLGVPQSQSLRVAKQEQEWSWSNAVCKPDGSFELPVAADMPYNIMVFDTTGRWVAAGVEGVQGQKDATVEVPDLLLTTGALVMGTVTDSSGKPMAGVDVCSYGPHRPASSATCIGAKTDVAGRYRLRVVPGFSRVYVGSNLRNQSQNVEVASGMVATVDFASP